MRDVQFISELMLAVLDKKVVGFDQGYLDDRYAFYDTPGENLTNFSHEDFQARMQDLRAYIVKMEETNSCISRWAKGLGNFYSLWSAVALAGPIADLPEAAVSAARYSDFMTMVDDLLNSDNVEETLAELGEVAEKDAVKAYATNAVGASTEPPQREARTEALINSLFRAR